MQDDGRNRQDPMSFALDAVQSLGNCGLGTVPQYPTPAMLAAGAKAGDVTVEQAFRIWLAMLRAAD